ncbi:Uncharacterised protein [Vibrio cholerae]|uniref:Uncharacterized protein n=1 Tax=Vibrio cholerae TaxID=666 RepID=A0A656AIA7_VIBCL|nr:Uncharacterised protein [Vibrio cholerae]CSD10952.1 Uncharacterised protein [Vibrio cholerae]
MPLIPKMPKSKRNWEIKSNVASPVTPPSLLRTSPPAKMMLKSGLLISIVATFKLLVTTRS